MPGSFDQDSIIIDISSDVTDAESARKALAAVDAEVNKLRADLNAGTVSLDHYWQSMDQLAARKGALNDWFGAAMTGTKAVGEGFQFSGQRLTVFAQTLDDLRYVPEMGLRPILNNLVQISPALGIAAIGAQFLYDHLDDIGGWVGQGHIPTLAEEMKTLGDKTQRTADEQDRLNELTRDQKIGQALETGQSEAEKKAQDATTKAINEVGETDLRRSVVMRSPDLIADDPDLKAARAKLAENTKYIADRQKLADTTDDADQRDRAGRDVAAATERRAKLQQAVAAAEEAAAHQFLISAAAGELARKRLIEAIEKDADAFGPKAGDLLADLKTIQAGGEPDDAGKKAKADQKKADAEAKHDLDARIREAEQDATKKTTDFYKQRDDLAEPLQKRFNSSRAAGEEVDQATIQAELERGGSSEADAAKFAGPVLDQLQKKFDAELTKRAAEKGITRDEAAGSIVDEDAKRKQDDADKQQRQQDSILTKARQSAEQAERDRAYQFKEQTEGTNVDGRTRNALLRAQFSANPEQDIRRIGQELFNQLKSGGMNERDANLATHDYIDERIAKLDEEVNKQVLKAPDPTKAPERIGVQDFARSVESAGMDLQKKSLDVQERMLDQLAELVRQKGGRATF